MCGSVYNDSYTYMYMWMTNLRAIFSELGEAHTLYMYSVYWHQGVWVGVCGMTSHIDVPIITVSAQTEWSMPYHSLIRDGSVLDSSKSRDASQP